MWESKKELKQELENAEMRAVNHFMKLNKIEKILKNAEQTHEMYYETVRKIKNVIYQPAKLHR